MKIEDQVTSLELSKRLKELGVKQESLFWWIESNADALTEEDGPEFIRTVKETKPYLGFYQNIDNLFKRYRILTSAFTVSELGEMLPNGFIQVKSKGRWFCRKDVVDEKLIKSSKTEASARAKMLIYLLENNLIEL